MLDTIFEMDSPKVSVLLIIISPQGYYSMFNNSALATNFIAQMVHDLNDAYYDMCIFLNLSDVIGKSSYNFVHKIWLDKCPKLLKILFSAYNYQLLIVLSRCT